MTLNGRVLVTNDDGIDADGIRALIPALIDAGFEPVVVAPNADYSGAGASILPLDGQGSDRRYEERTLDEAPGVEAFALHGPPALCVLLAMRGAFGEQPVAVASGINFGLNCGPAVMHSGTVSAALVGGRFNVPSIAVSSRFDFEKPDEPLRYDTAAVLAADLLGRIADRPGTTLNLNVPQCDASELRGVREATLSPTVPYRSYVESRSDGLLKMAFEAVDHEPPPGSDTGLVEAGFAAVTSLRATGEAADSCASVLTGLTGAAA